MNSNLWQGNMASNNDGIYKLDIPEIDTEYKNDERSITSIADEILNLDIPPYNLGNGEIVFGKQLYKCEKCKINYKTICGHRNLQHTDANLLKRYGFT